MKKMIMACLGAMLLLSACSTMQGLGQDISDTGDDIASVAKKAQDRINSY